MPGQIQSELVEQKICKSLVARDVAPVLSGFVTKSRLEHTTRSRAGAAGGRRGPASDDRSGWLLAGRLVIIIVPLAVDWLIGWLRLQSPPLITVIEGTPQ